MMRHTLLALLILSVTASSLAKAEEKKTDSQPLPDKKKLTVIVGPGQKEPDPIAIAPAFCQTQASICNEVGEILRADLTLSLFFKVLNPKTFVAKMSRESLSRTSWKDWFNVGSVYLIKARVSGNSRSIKLEFRLYNVSDKKTYTLRTQDQSGLSMGGSLRAGVHKFVNEVIKVTTGTPGIFGSKIAYSARTGRETSGIFVIGIDGKGGYGVAGGTINMLPAWMGGNLLYTSFKEGTPQIFLGKKRISRDSGHYYKAASSKDGTLAVTVNRGGQSDIYIMKDGRLVKNLTNHSSDDLSPSWEPSGKRIAFVSNRSGGPQIFIMNADGSGQRRLTFAGNYNTEPDFGPNGLIVFSTQIDGKYDILTVDMAGNLQRITQDQGSNQSPTWSPDGRYIAFVSNRGGKRRIWIATADGRFQMPITEKSGGYRSLAWSR